MTPRWKDWVSGSLEVIRGGRLEGRRHREQRCERIFRALQPTLPERIDPEPLALSHRVQPRPARRRAVAVALATLGAAAAVALWWRPERADPPDSMDASLISPLLQVPALVASGYDSIETTVDNAIDFASCFGTAQRAAAARAEGTEQLQRALDEFRATISHLPEVQQELVNSRIAEGRIEPLRSPAVQLSLAEGLRVLGGLEAGREVSWLPELLPHLLPQQLQLRIIDLDAGGALLDGLPVYAEYAELATGRLGEPTFLGYAPFLQKLQPGDVRITVIDRARRRQSVLRLWVLPDRPIAPQLAFLRAVPFGSEVAHFAGGTFTYGTRTREGLPSPVTRPLSHRPGGPEELGPFAIDVHETTNEQYLAFLRDLAAHPEWREGGYATCTTDLPFLLAENPEVAQALTCDAAMAPLAVLGVTWYQAMLYANWAGKRLPLDREWERAAEGLEGRAYPFGDTFDPERVFLAGKYKMVPVPGVPGSFTQSTLPPQSGPVGDKPRGATPEGVLRLADNVREWVEDVFAISVPSGDCSLTMLPADASGLELQRCVRGASFRNASAAQCMVDVRSSGVPTAVDAANGVRCVVPAWPAFADRLLDEDR